MTILTYIVLSPLLMAALLLLVPNTSQLRTRWGALLATLVSAILATIAFFKFDPAIAGYQFEQKIPWSSTLGISFHLGVDGLSLGLIWMGAIVSFAACCLSKDIVEREKEYYILLLLMTGGILGAFASLDLVSMYVLHELALVPTFIMIGVWGRGKDRNYAAYKITLYLSAGALLTLAGLIALYIQTGAKSFDLPEIMGFAVNHPISLPAQNYIFPLLLFGLGILVSLWPFHTWAPLSYAAAPTGTAMMHAGVIKKFGLFALLRIALPLMPDAAQLWMQILAWLCLGNILYCGLVALNQKNINLLLGNSSVAHMGIVFLGIASLNLIGVTGAVFVMIAHGLLAALSFGLSGYLYQQTKTLEIGRYGGLLRELPFLGTCMIMALFAGCGLPGFGNFVGELSVFFGAWKEHKVPVIIACWGALVIGSIYMLRAIRAIWHGPITKPDGVLCDAAGNRLPFVILLAALIWLGFCPNWLVRRIEPSLKTILQPFSNRSQAVTPMPIPPVAKR